MGVQWPIWGYPVRLLIPGLPDQTTEIVTETCRQNGISVENISTCGLDSERVIDWRHQQLQDNLEREGLPGLGLYLLKPEKKQSPTEQQTKQSHLPDADVGLTMDGLQQAITRAVCYRYNQMADPGKTVSRLARWELAITGDQKHAGVGLPEKPGFNDIVNLLPRAGVKVGPKRLKLNDISYDSSEARAHRKATRWTNQTRRHRVQTIEDPLDLSHVWMKYEDYWLELRSTTLPDGPQDKWSQLARYKAQALAERNTP